MKFNINTAHDAKNELMERFIAIGDAGWQSELWAMVNDTVGPGPIDDLERFPKRRGAVLQRAREVALLFNQPIGQWLPAARAATLPWTRESVVTECINTLYGRLVQRTAIEAADRELAKDRRGVGRGR